MAESKKEKRKVIVKRAYELSFLYEKDCVEFSVQTKAIILFIEVNIRMNSLYCFEISNTCRTYIAGINWKAARNEALRLELFRENMTKLPQIKGRRILRNCTEWTGVLTLKEIMELKMVWWDCGGDRCNSHDFICIDGGQGYRCKICGYEGCIPKQVSEEIT